MKTYKDVGSYIRSFPKVTQIQLKKLRTVIKNVTPKAEERISYGMPGYKLGGRPLVYFGGFKKHVSLFALPSGTTAFKKELAKYKISKGTIQFPINRPLPLGLIRRVVRYRTKENLNRIKK